MANDTSDVIAQLTWLRIEHRDLDEAILQLSAKSGADQLQLRRLKKRKLRIKDMLSYLESKLIPDLDA
ncbi:MAG: hypothetical protein BWZ07_00283 [Alphaproteobacteria bacterium ADurb.BinA280]|jgi:hypothetical protein|nr:DUF465 domain-containing protein [Xanthomonadales bacterium]MCC6506761.1 DUF465 domain-containing protein [Aquimonas sp.]OPZ13771.1 MAG: hypothetical protein BWZ07_00283 [Alphaproteobacteria bacterium ADurb.BinA280]